MPTHNFQIRNPVTILLTIFIIVLSLDPVSAQSSNASVNIGELIGILLLIFGVLGVIWGLIWMFAYPIFLLYALIFSGKNLDNMILKTVERERTIISKFGKDILSNIDGGFRKDVGSSGIVWAGAVYGPSHWHQLLGKLYNWFGGSIDIFQKVISAGRAESMQRLREIAIEEGWDEVINVRIDTSPMAPAAGRKGIKAVEVFAYGTGIKYS